jgi:4-amino-4-deoxy-L-arabinose transferase-like glycosyltransferase
MIAIALLLPTVLGFLVLALILHNKSETGLLERLCLAYPLGAGILTMHMFVLGLARVPLTLLTTSLPMVLEIVALVFWLAKNRITFAPRPAFGLREEIVDPGTPIWKKTALLVLSFWLGAKVLSIFIETGLRPIFAWDAWANWSVGAKLFYYTKGLMLDAPQQDFFTRGAVLRITAYPLHNPLMQTWLSLWAGGFDEVLVKFWNPAYLLSLVIYLYCIASRELNRMTALGLSVIFLSSPLLSYHAIEAYSDLALSVYFLLAATSFLFAMRGEKAFWILAGLFSAEALFTKDEAMFFILPLLMSAALFIWRNPATAEKRQALLRLAIPLLLVAPWFIFKYSHTLGLGAEHIKLEFTFHPEVVWLAVLQVCSLENFNIILVLFPILLVVNGKPSDEFLHIFLAVLCYAAFFVAVYMVTTFYYGHFSSGTVFFRNILTFYPVVLLLTVLQIKKSSSRVFPQATTASPGPVPRQKRKLQHT